MTVMSNPGSLDPFGLSTEIHRKICAVFAGHEAIEKLIIYGSRAMGTFREGSDIDLTVYGENLDYELLSIIIREIEDLNLPYLFDISIYDHIEDPDLRSHIDRIGKVFCDFH